MEHGSSLMGSRKASWYNARSIIYFCVTLDQTKIDSFIGDNYGHVGFKKKETSLKGWNWGHLNLQGTEEKKHLSMEIGGRTAIECPVSEVSNAMVAAKMN